MLLGIVLATRAVTIDAQRSRILGLDDPGSSFCRYACALSSPRWIMRSAAHRANADDFRGSLQGDFPTRLPLALLVELELCVVCYRMSETRASVQPFATPISLPAPIERFRDLTVWHLARQLSDSGPTCLRRLCSDTCHWFSLELSIVWSAQPVQFHFNKNVFDAHNDLMRCRTNNPFTCRDARSWMRPGTFQICAEHHQVLLLLLA